MATSVTVDRVFEQPSFSTSFVALSVGPKVSATPFDANVGSAYVPPGDVADFPMRPSWRKVVRQIG